MSMHIFEEAREYIIPLFTAKVIGNSVDINSRKYLGTAFFVTKKGDAITAAHVIPAPEELSENLRLIAVAWVHGKEEVCWVNRAAVFEDCDLALLEINLPDTRFLEISLAEVYAGTDVYAIGMPDHEVSSAGKEMRVLKGHVTLSNKNLELNFPIPSGMSGAPVLVGSEVIGYATGVVRSEVVIDQYESDIKLTNTTEQIQINTISSVVYYGLAYPFYKLKSARSFVLDNKTLSEFIAERNT
jgi:Trypsin-like peptidase domain